MAWPARPCACGWATPACWLPTCRTRSPSRASGWPPSCRAPWRVGGGGPAGRWGAPGGGGWRVGARGGRLPVLVLFPVPPGFVSDAAQHDVTLTLGDETLLLRTLDAWGSRSGAARSAGARTLGVQLELE